jgi:ketosteroid isomerase-like protein
LSAHDVVDAYFRDLEEGRFEQAAAHFTPDAFYSHPPFPEEGADAPRHETRGRDALLAVFQHRGVRTLRHSIEAVASVGDEFFVRGVVKDGQTVIMSFVSVGRIDQESGLISDYAAYASAPAVGHALASQAS